VSAKRPGFRIFHAVALLAALALLYVGRAVFGDRVLLPIDLLADEGPWKAEPADRVVVSNPLLSDPVHQFHPWDVASRARLEEGRFPWTNPRAGQGEPLWANPQAALLSPFTWTRLALGIRGWALCVFLKLLVAGLGAFAFARELNASRAAAAVSGAIYLLSGFSILWGLHPHTNVFCVLPWLGLSAHRLLRRPAPGPAAATIAAAALATAGGHPETLAIGVTGLAAFLAFEARALAFEGGKPAFFRVAAAAAVGFLLLATQLLPFALLLQDSRFVQQRAAFPGGGGLRVFAIAGQVLPGLLGSPLASEIDLSGAVRGSENFNLRSEGFVGLIALLALLFTARRIPDPMRRGLCIGAVALIVSWRVPPLGWLWSHTPGLRLFAPEYAILVFVLFASLAAGPALEAWSALPTRHGKRLAAIGLLCAGALLAAAGAAPLTPAGESALERAARGGVARLRESGHLKASEETYAARLQGYVERATTTAWRRGALPGVCWMLAGAALLLGGRRRAPWLLAGAAVGELVAFGYGYLPSVPLSRVPPEPDAIAYLRARPAAGGTIAGAFDSYHPDLPGVAGVRDVRSHSLLESRASIDRLVACGYEPRFLVFPDVLSDEQAGCLARLGVQYYLSRRGQNEAPRVAGGVPPAVGVYELPSPAAPPAPDRGPPRGFAAGLGVTLLAAGAAVLLVASPSRP
jgi:hypothetical protein